MPLKNLILIPTPSCMHSQLQCKSLRWKMVAIKANLNAQHKKIHLKKLCMHSLQMHPTVFTVQQLKVFLDMGKKLMCIISIDQFKLHSYRTIASDAWSHKL